MQDETDAFSIRVIPICVPALYSVPSCMSVSVTANLYGCYAGRNAGNSPEAPLPQNRKPGVYTSTRTNTKVLR